MHACSKTWKQQNFAASCCHSKSSCACSIKSFCQASSSSPSELGELAECIMCQADALTKVWSSAGSPVLQALSISTPLDILVATSQCSVSLAVTPMHCVEGLQNPVVQVGCGLLLAAAPAQSPEVLLLFDVKNLQESLKGREIMISQRAYLPSREPSCHFSRTLKCCMHNTYTW